ncbi:hypothetical protein ZWY2020_047943 [Hordeum vulgare]|nr:hypothetical protein ZWY2020_047943 [Hordeum vulgare]
MEAQSDSVAAETREAQRSRVGEQRRSRLAGWQVRPGEAAVEPAAQTRAKARWRRILLGEAVAMARGGADLFFHMPSVQKKLQRCRPGPEGRRTGRAPRAP